jgi:TolB-like protein
MPVAVAGKRSVGVLPFRLLTPDPSDAYLSAALADAVVICLGESGTLLVRPTSAVMRYANALTDPLVAGRELNVDVVIDGSVQRVDRRLRVHVQAREVVSGEVLSSTRHDADTGDLFGLQDIVAESLGRALGSSAPGASAGPSRPPTANARAYELFLRASERLLSFNRWDTRSAIE